MSKWVYTFVGSLLFVLACFIGLAHGQDVVNPTTSAYLTLARGNSWGSAGACGSGAGCGVNNSYVWSPPTPDSTVCIAITNNNPTNAHSLTLALNQTLDATVTTFFGNAGAWATVPITGVTFPQTVPASSTISFFFRSSSAAKLALVVSGTGALGGSPDTANITVVQPSTASFCGSSTNQSSIVAVVGATGAGNTIPATLNQPVLVGGKQNSGGTENNVAMYADVDSSSKGFLVGAVEGINESTAISALTTLNNLGGGGNGLVGVQQWGMETDTAIGGGAGDDMSVPRVSRAYGQVASSIFTWASTQDNGGNGVPLSAYQTQNDLVNPAAGQLLVSVNASAPNNGITPFRITVSCSVACDYTINRVTTAGTTCTAATIVKTYDPAIGTTPGFTAVKGTCVANPTISQTLYHFWLAAGGTQVTDMTGYYWRNNTATGNGFDVQEGTAVTGTVSTTFEFMNRSGSN